MHLDLTLDAEFLKEKLVRERARLARKFDFIMYQADEPGLPREESERHLQAAERFRQQLETFDALFKCFI